MKKRKKNYHGKSMRCGYRKLACESRQINKNETGRNKDMKEGK